MHCDHLVEPTRLHQRSQYGFAILALPFIEQQHDLPVALFIFL
ncbi:MAG: hypothetical protein ACSLEM_02070 [Candidatus Malihini olakiniferum]